MAVDTLHWPVPRMLMTTPLLWVITSTLSWESKGVLGRGVEEGKAISKTTQGHLGAHVKNTETSVFVQDLNNQTNPHVCVLCTEMLGNSQSKEYRGQLLLAKVAGTLTPETQTLTSGASPECIHIAGR